MRLLFAVLLTLISPASLLQAHDLDWKSLLIASLKLRPGLDYEANVDSYMEAFRPDVWKRFRNDEFEMVGKRKETIELMKQSIANFSLQETFTVRTTTKFGSYEFESKSFPIDGWSESSFFYASTYTYGSFPDTINVFLNNPKAVTRIALGEVQAKEFVRSRKDSYGEVDRKLYVILQLRILKAKSYPDELLAEICGYRIYADEKCSKLLQEFEIAKPVPTKEVAVSPIIQKSKP